MKTTIKKNLGLIMFAFAILFSTSMAQAHPPQGQQGPPPIPDDKSVEQMVSNLSTELSLDAAQEKQVSKIFKAHFDEAREKMEGSKGSSMPNRSEMEKLKADFEKDVKAILTKDQQKMFDAFMKKIDPQRGKQPAKGKGKP